LAETLIWPGFDGVAFLESCGVQRGGNDAQQLFSRCAPRGRRAGALRDNVSQLAETFGMSEATIYNWTKQESIDRGEVQGQSTEQALELEAAKRRIRQLETELAVSRKVNEVFLDQDLAPKASTR
jgi:transposase